MTTVLELKARLDALLSTAQVETANIDLFAPIAVADREECPLCLIPLPMSNRSFMSCCGKLICNGCVYKNLETESDKGLRSIINHKCAFCRQPSLGGNTIKRLKKLMKKNNPQSFIQMADKYRSGDGVFQSDTKSLEMYICAAELGNAEAYENIGWHYEQGIVVEQNISKAFGFYEVAAKKGSVLAHRYLAILHERIKNNQLCIKHVKVAACAGHQGSMDSLMKFYKAKLLSKEDLAQTLRDFQSSNNEMKSKDRDDARVLFD